MNGSTEGNVKNETINSEIESDDSDSYSEVVPGAMDSALRRHYLQEMVKTMPESVQGKLADLKSMQLEHLQIDVDYFKEIFNLEIKYHEKFQELFAKRAKVVQGIVDPPEEKPKWKEPEQTIMEGDDDQSTGGQRDSKEKQAFLYDESQLTEELCRKIIDIKNMPLDAKGIPGFWLTVFRNMSIMSNLIQTFDEPVLRKLTDVMVTYGDDLSFTIEFHFEKNKFFSNHILTKQFFRTSTFDPNDPFAAEISEIYKCKGCKINWKNKMDLTLKTMRKKQKHKAPDASPVVKKFSTISFFNFFRRPGYPFIHFRIGTFLRTRGIPRAVLYYTGDVVDKYGEEMEDEEAEDEEESSDTDKVFGSKSKGDKNKKPSPDEDNDEQ